MRDMRMGNVAKELNIDTGIAKAFDGSVEM